MITASEEACLIGHSSAVNAVRFTRDGRYCLTCSDDRTVKLWNPFRITNNLDQGNEGLLIKTYMGAHGYGVLDLVVSHDNESFASAGHDKTVFIWDVTTAKVLRKLHGHQHRVNALAINADSTILASASYDQHVNLWDMRTKNRAPLQTLTECKDSATSIVMSEYRIIVGSVDGVLRTYDMRKGLLTCDDLGSPIVSLRLDKKQESVLTLCLGVSKEGGSIFKTLLESPKVQRVWSSSGNCSFKSESIFCKDESMVVSGDEEGNLRWWGEKSGAERGDKSSSAEVAPRTLGHTAPVSSVSCHPSQLYLLSAGYEPTVKLWSLV